MTPGVHAQSCLTKIMTYTYQFKPKVTRLKRLTILCSVGRKLIFAPADNKTPPFRTVPEPPHLSVVRNHQKTMTVIVEK